MKDTCAWTVLEKEPWQSIESLGQEWLIKTQCGPEGYGVMVTDGTAIYGERRNQVYVQEKAEEWASCIEAGVHQLSSLILSELCKTKALSASWTKDRSQVTLGLISSLNDMSYSWEFTFKRLSDNLLGAHFVSPLLVQMHNLTMLNQYLRGELQQKQRQLDELAPEKAANRNKVQSKRDKGHTLEESVKLVLETGSWTVLEPHMLTYPHIIQEISTYREKKSVQLESVKCENNSLDDSLFLSPSNSQIKGLSKKTIQPKVEEDPETQRLLELQRRAKIQQLSQPNTQSKPQPKKKKLNI